MKLFLIFLFPLVLLAQNENLTFEDNIQKAFDNAKKGMYFAFANIPAKKNDFSREIVEEDKLIAKVKLYKAANGVRAEATGIYNTYEVCITAFRTYQSLLKDGFIKHIPADEGY